MSKQERRIRISGQICIEVIISCSMKSILEDANVIEGAELGLNRLLTFKGLQNLNSGISSLTKACTVKAANALPGTIEEIYPVLNLLTVFSRKEESQ